MEEEYDFSEGEIGCYADSFAAGSNVILLEPDVAKEFRTAQEVNRALRVYLKNKKQSGVA